MTLWGLFLIIAVIVIVLSFSLKGILSKKSSTEIMILGLLFILTGGILLIEPNLPKNTMIILIEFGFVIFGFFVGALGFFKD
ncbi:hypothetical protein [Aquisalibacillus elongatus]|uniref:Uncharacterized protein n=1 Tax=Aquisalibacillus elongatus TaxID=485577 RepID=A0A3N5BH22_9BACI|nr:hypothetical protein [Aquisalibacillus elongatus]RPF57076.1 hypothetical protein EDC24_0027 [Aquisalibacillus elongatus]